MKRRWEEEEEEEEEEEGGCVPRLLCQWNSTIGREKTAHSSNCPMSNKAEQAPTFFFLSPFLLLHFLLLLLLLLRLLLHLLLLFLIFYFLLLGRRSRFSRSS